MKPDPARLAMVSLFEDLSGEELDLLVSWTEEHEVSRGQSLVSEGAAGYVFFVIEEGTAAVERDGEFLRELGPGDHFGEIAILDGGRRTATVVATSDQWQHWRHSLIVLGRGPCALGPSGDPDLPSAETLAALRSQLGTVMR